MFKLTQKQLQRYSRQLIIPEIGLKGQEKLAKAKVLVVGAGGLGSVSLLYLAAAGIGNIGIVDDDVVKLENLNRQILYTAQDIGKNKVAAAKQKLKSLNNEIKIETYNLRLNENNAGKIFKKYEIILDCTDNIEARLAINETAYELRKKWVYGSVFLLSGQTSTIIPRDTFCYRCLFEGRPSMDDIPEDLKGGILGVAPALIGSIQATEVIKMIIGKGELLTNKLLIYQALPMKFDIIDVKKRKNCPVCSRQKTEVRN